MPHVLRIYVLAAFLLVPNLLGCGESVPPRVVPDLPDPAAAAKALELYDTNHDGFLDAQELEQVPGLKAAMKQVDTNHDGKISAQEIAEQINEWAESRMGRLQVTCRVTHNGKPLAKATVVFVPEKFLGGTLQSGSGSTSQTGAAQIAAPYPANPTIQGLAPGFYRVEITKEGEKIPARYNSETTLGAEVASGPAWDPNGLNFKLEY